MLARVHSAATLGLDACVLDVEVDASPGFPRFTMVGLPDASVREARERVRSALKNAGFTPPLCAVTVNLAPAGFRKCGASLDLPLALALLWHSGVRPPTPVRRVLAGELGLGGEVRGIRGSLALALAARDAGFSEILLPAESAAEAAAVEGIRVVPVAHLSHAVDHVLGRAPIPPLPTAPAEKPRPAGPDFSEIRGQAIARRAAEIAAAGGHHLLLTGPPGAGKTMLARRLPGLLPALERAEALEVTRIHSIAGVLPAGSGLIATPPFRAPHHGISAAGLVGGGPRPMPGEMSLAHRGILFLDELPEFRRDVLEGVRQPLEERRVSIVRVAGARAFPCDVLLVAAMNPCPCGMLGDPRRPCRCDARERTRYARKLSGPLLDRIDMHVSVEAVPWRDVRSPGQSESSASIRSRVEAARNRARLRRPDVDAFRNADLSASELTQHAPLDASGRRLLETAVTRAGLSLRALHRALRVARTIADLAESDRVHPAHLAEALSLRAPVRLDPLACPIEQG